MAILKMADLDLNGKRVLIRADLNVPIEDGKVASEKRIVDSLPTIELAMKKGGRVMVISHLGRPTEGEYAEEFSLKPVADFIQTKLPDVKVRLVSNDEYLKGVEPKAGELLVLENCRFNKGE
ncbi:MAG: phosphoglycerate kinase, partial [Succinivibrio sp.]|nr:phosphoglycerate kinase [Succinivibrio sp.]